MSPIANDTDDASPACEICGNRSGNRMHEAREMMFGLRERFSYLECIACGCLQNRSVPADLGRFYGPGYYSVAARPAPRRGWYEAMKASRTRTHLAGGGLIGRVLLKAFGAPGLPDWVNKAGMRQHHRILEIGCGSGDLLLNLRSEGFKHLTGADPFIEHDLDHGGGLKIHKKFVAELQGPYDFIVLEHAFEHIPDAHATLAGLRGLLAPHGTLVIAIPLVAQAWRRYGVNWVQLDAPRHLYLHTEKSLRLLAQDARLDVTEVDYDSGPVQFWGSEQYAQDISLFDERSVRVNPASSLFTRTQMAGFAAEAARLNAARDGDQATFYLRHLPA